MGKNIGVAMVEAIKKYEIESKEREEAIKHLQEIYKISYEDARDIINDIKTLKEVSDKKLSKMDDAGMLGNSIFE